MAFDFLAGASLRRGALGIAAAAALVDVGLRATAARPHDNERIHVAHDADEP